MQQEWINEGKKGTFVIVSTVKIDFLKIVSQNIIVIYYLKLMLRVFCPFVHVVICLP